MVDLHCHILPALDDGPQTLASAVELARVAHAAGIETLVATPHIRDDFPFPVESIPGRLLELRGALEDAEVDIEVISGGEVDLLMLTELDDVTLSALCLGEGRYVLVESPYGRAPSLLEAALFDLQLRSFRPILAHPERSMTFLHDRARLERLVERGVLCSVTTMSLTGSFGRTVRDFAVGMMADGLVHNIASDAHNASGRAPGFAPALQEMEVLFEGGGEAGRWLVGEAARAVVNGQEIPLARPSLEPRRTGWRRMTKRVGLR